jgi:threonine synthase
VKGLFNDRPFREELQISAVNSINWARVMAQIVYYVTSAVALGAPDRPVSFAVPTGNFGNVLAGYAAKRMGLPVDQLIVGSNANDILARFFDTGAMTMESVQPTYSPSMDIQVSSNFERLLFELLGRDGAKTAGLIGGFRQSGRFEVSGEEHAKALEDFAGFRLDDAGTLAEMKRCHAATREVLDPHSAIGVAAARAKRRDPETPVVALATAHPAKFPQAVEQALGFAPALPARLADLYEREERYDRLENDLPALEAYVRERARITSGAAA